MTREEAKQWLEAMKSSYALPTETYEALDMAIEALKQVTGKLNNPDDSLLTADSEACKEQKSKLDLISRAEAIETVRLETGMRGLLGRGDLLEILYSLPSAETTGALDDAIAKYVADGLMELPSAEAECIPIEYIEDQIEEYRNFDHLGMYAEFLDMFIQDYKDNAMANYADRKTEHMERSEE